MCVRCLTQGLAGSKGGESGSCCYKKLLETGFCLIDPSWHRRVPAKRQNFLPALPQDSACSVLLLEFRCSFIHQRIRQLGPFHLSWRELTALLLCSQMASLNGEVIYHILSLNTGVLVKFCMKMKNTSHGVVHLPLWTPSPSFYPAPAGRLTLCTISMSLLALWLLAGFGQWETPAGDLEWGPSFLPVAPSLSCPCGLAVIPTAGAAPVPVQQPSPNALSLVCANSPSGNSSPAGQATRQCIIRGCLS